MKRNVIAGLLALCVSGFAFSANGQDAGGTAQPPAPGLSGLNIQYAITPDKVRDMHIYSLIHKHCNLAFNDDKAVIFARTYGEDGELEAAVIDTAIAAGEKIVENSVRLKQIDNMCTFGRLAVEGIDPKWLTWLRS